MIRVIVNGREREIETGTTIAGLIDSLGLTDRRCAVERNRPGGRSRVIVKRDEWARTSLEDGDELEVLHFVGGGRD